MPKGKYSLEHVMTPVLNTSTWHPQMVPADVWWITGPGINRPATDIEVDLWLQAQASGQ